MTTPPPSPRGPVVALLASSHPGPTAAVTVMSLLLGAAAGLEPWRLAVLAVAVLVGQLSIGWSNDAIDAERDIESGRRDKPVARGDIARRTVWTWALAALAGGVALTLPLGAAATALHATIVAAGWAYNAWLKRTAASPLPFLVAFGLLPALAVAALPGAPAAAWWALAAGALFGVAIHVTNTLPDLDDDRRTGVRGLPHRIGLPVAGDVAFGALAAAGVVVAVGVLGAGADGLRSALTLAGTAAVCAISAAGIVRIRRGRVDRRCFQLVIAAALLVGAQLLVAGGDIVA